MTIADIYSRARFFLNDSISFYTDAQLLEAVKSANDELSDELIANGIATQKYVSAAIDYTANATTITLTTIADMIVPIKLQERADGSSDLYTPMAEGAWPVEAVPGTDLIYWNYRNNLLNVLPATTNREVKVDYLRALVQPASSSSNSEVIGSRNYLSYKTAALAVEAIGGNQVEADRLHSFAAKHLDKLLKIGVRNTQGIKTRRRGFRINLRRFF